MTEIKWLDVYAGQTTNELIELEGKYRTDSIVLAFEQAINQKAQLVGIDNLTIEERIVLAVEALEREVNNGGYSQFFTNPSKRHVPIIIDALQRIYCTKTAKITQRAIDFLGVKVPITLTAIDNVMFQEENDELEGKLCECDKEYYKIAGDLSIPLLNYIKNNKHKIVLDPEVFRSEKKPWWKFW
jgi:hypothetical protein